MQVDKIGQISRRGLLGAGAGLAASATVLGAGTRSAAGAVGDGDVVSLLPSDRIGLQLYSVRDAIADVGFEKVFASLAETGFKSVEFAGYTQGSSPEITLVQLRALLDEYGLEGLGSHVTATDDASMQKILDDAEVLGLPQVGNSFVLPSGPPTVDGWKAAAATANHYGELASRRGMTYYLHNHFQEWAPCVDDPSKRGHDVLLAECDPRYVHLELDIFWCYVGSAQNNNGFDPIKDYLIPHRGRYRLFHVKDGVYDDKPAGTITDVGEGKIEFQTLFTELFKQAPDEASRHIYLWENDNAGNHPRGPLAAARASYANMRYALTRPAPAEEDDTAPDDSCARITPPAGDCTTPAGLAAALNRVRFRRTKSGRRILGVGLRLDRDARVAVKLTRDGKTLAKASKRLAEGASTLNLSVPRRAAKGPARLTVSVKSDSGAGVTVRRIVQVPPVRRRARHG